MRNTFTVNDLKKFKHRIEEKVKFHEVDLLGVCNNAVYFNYFEDARIGYSQTLKDKYKLNRFFNGLSFFIMVHNECDYYKPAHLDDDLEIYTRVEFAKRSSFGFHHLVFRKSTNDIIAEGRGVVVHITKESKNAVQLPQEFYSAVKDFEEDVKIIFE